LQSSKKRKYNTWASSGGGLEQVFTTNTEKRVFIHLFMKVS